MSRHAVRMGPPKVAYTLQEAATATGLSVASLTRAMHTSGPKAPIPRLRAKRVGNRYLILATDLQAGLEARPDVGDGPAWLPDDEPRRVDLRALRPRRSRG